MARYIDVDLLKEMIEAKADTVLNAKQQFLYIAKWLDYLPPADVVPKSEVDKLEYTLTGVMHSVDKWLDGEELKQDEVNRAITMREKTLRIVEQYQEKLEDYKDCWYKIHDSYNADCRESYNIGRQEVAREIFEEIEKKSQYFPRFYCIHLLDYNEIKKKYTESEGKG